MRGLPHPRRGSSLPVAIVFALLLVSLGVFLLAPIQNAGRHEANRVRTLALRTLAEGGVDTMVHLLAGDRSEQAQDWSIQTPAGTLHCESSRDAEHADLWRLVSTASDPAGKRQVVIHAALLLGAANAEGRREVETLLEGRTAQVVDALR